MVSIGRRVAVCAALGAATAGFNVLSAAPAAADTVRVKYACSAGTHVIATLHFHITVNAPVTVRRGQTATVTASVVKEESPAAMTVPANTLPGRLLLEVGGAGSGTVWVEGLNNPELQPGERYRWEDGSAQVTFPNTGDVTFRPIKFGYGPRLGCWEYVGTTASVAATTHVLPN